MPLIIWATMLAGMFNKTVTSIFYGLLGIFFVLWFIRTILIVVVLIILNHFGKRRCPSSTI